MGVTDTKMIKSARRVLEVLEYFDQDRRTATVMDIARSLGYPQSSTSELLRCLVTLGYLHYNRYSRIYQPTPRVALIGAWVDPDLFRDGVLLPAVDTIVQATGETVVLSSAVNYTVQHIHVVHGTRPDSVIEHVGGTASLLHSAQGRLLLATYSDVHIRSAVHRLNADEPDPDRRVRPNELIDELRTLRRQGWAVETGMDGDLGTVSVVLRQRRGGQRLVLSVMAKSAVIAARGEEIREIIAAAGFGSSAARLASNDDDRPALPDVAVRPAYTPPPAYA